MVKHIFCKRLRQAMELKNCSGVELARKTGLTASTLTNYATGRCLPSLDTLVKIAVGLNVTTDYLLGVSDNPETMATFRKNYDGNSFNPIINDVASMLCENNFEFDIVAPSYLKCYASDDCVVIITVHENDIIVDKQRMSIDSLKEYLYDAKDAVT